MAELTRMKGEPWSCSFLLEIEPEPFPVLVAVHIACSACRSYGCRGCPRALDSQRLSQQTANIPGPGRPALH